MKNIIVSIIVIFALYSCDKDMLPKEVNFDVKVFNNALVETDTFKVNDTINFKFTGNPDFITFYSGETGSEYRCMGRTSQKSYLDTLTFTSKYDTVGVTGKVKLYISKNLSNYTQYNSADSLAVLAAKWTDISDRALWATTTTAVSSGKISLNAEAATDSLVWLAFRYTAPAGTDQSTWSISGINLQHYADNAVFSILSTNTVMPLTMPNYSVSPGWGAVDLLPRIGKWGWVPDKTSGTTTIGQSLATQASTTKLTVSGMHKTPLASRDIDAWIIAGPINLSRVLPDVGVQIKSYSENAMNISKGIFASMNANYTYRFAKPGTYTVVFEASNVTVDGQNKAIKQFTLVVK